MNTKTLQTFVLLALFVFSGCFGAQKKDGEMNWKASLAGSWYSADGAELRRMLETHIDAAKIPDIDGRIYGIIAPHAGYTYSAPVAAHAAKLLRQNRSEYRNNTVIIIGFSHKSIASRGLSIWTGGNFTTPLGTIAVDEELAKKIAAHDTLFSFRPEAFDSEQSIEMQIPLLQTALGNNFKILPIAFMYQSLNEIDALANALIESDIDWEKTLLVFSTDMTHYLPYSKAVEYDTLTVNNILANDVDGLIDEFQNKIDALCGVAPVLTAMLVMPHIGAQNPLLLKYANSGDILPESAAQGVVGYCSIVYTKNAQKNKPQDAPKVDFLLTDDQKDYLLRLARKTIEEIVVNKKTYEPELPADSILAADAPVFVTLHKAHNLRGCIGQMMARGPMYLAVRDMAIAAATQDSRFAQVSPNELTDINIEISVLSPLQKVKSYKEIIPKKHGVYIKRAFRSGVFLPQVWEQIPDRDDFLAELCRQKANLPADYYKNPDAEIYVYTVLEFSEKR